MYPVDKQRILKVMITDTQKNHIIIKLTRSLDRYP